MTILRGRKVRREGWAAGGSGKLVTRDLLERTGVVSQETGQGRLAGAGFAMDPEKLTATFVGPFSILAMT